MQLSPARGKFLQVQAAILREIQARRLRLGDRIPSEPQLARRLQVSRETVRKAIARLVRDGIVETRRGHGHIVCSVRPRSVIGVLFNRNVFLPQTGAFPRLLLRGIYHEIARRGGKVRLYQPVVENLEYQFDHERLMQHIRRGLFAGLITMYWPESPSTHPPLAARDQQTLDLLRSQRIPMVMLTDQVAPASVGLDLPHIGYIGARHLLDQGLRRIGLLMAPASGGSSGAFEALHRGYGQALREADVLPRLSWIQRAPEISEAGGFLAVRRWSGIRQLQGLVIPDDHLTKGAVLAAMTKGIRVPQQFQIAGLSIKGGELFFPVPTTRIELDPEAIARALVEQLWAQFDDPDRLPPMRLIESRIVDASVGLPATAIA